MSSGPEVFARLYADHVDAVLGYALRRCASTDAAADVVSETFLVAWRRLGEVPAEPDTRPWLYGVARRVLANQRRGVERRHRLGARLRDELDAAVPDHAERVATRTDLARAIAALPRRDREVLELSVWEELAPREIAEVLGTTSLAVRTRLSRARARVREHLSEERGNDPGRAGHHPSTDTHLSVQES